MGYTLYLYLPFFTPLNGFLFILLFSLINFSIAFFYSKKSKMSFNKLIIPALTITLVYAVYLFTLFFEPFNVLFIIIFFSLLALSVAFFYFEKSKMDFNESITPALALILVTTSILWISLFSSYEHIHDPPHLKNPTKEFATGGFPLKAFVYPCCFMGGNQPPTEQWSNFFLNFGIIYLACLLVFIFFYKIKFNRFISDFLLTFLLIIINLIGIIYVGLAFD